MVDNIKGFRKLRRQNKAKKIHLHPMEKGKNRGKSKGMVSVTYCKIKI
jgi:hypothetical protein